MATCNNPGASLVFGHSMPSDITELARYKGEIEAGLVHVPVMWRRTPRGPLVKGSIEIQRRVANNLRAVMDDIAMHPEVAFVYGGSYNFRRMNGRKPTNRASIHSLGLAIDVNVEWNPYARDGRSDDAYHMRSTAHPIVRAFMSRGWEWGGNWRVPDYMHFEFSTGKGSVDGRPDYNLAGRAPGRSFAAPTAACPFDFNKAAEWSRANCSTKSMHKCAGYVKKALQAGGCTYVTGDGFTNQKFCRTNGFVCISDFRPVDAHPRPTATRPIQWGLAGYVPQLGDVCLIEHPSSGVGHMAWFPGGPDGLNGWVSDFWQRPPGQQPGCGPYCYSSGITRVQIWRHESLLNGIVDGYFSTSPDYIFQDRVVNAIKDVRIPEFNPHVIERAEIVPDEPQAWLAGMSPESVLTTAPGDFVPHPDMESLRDLTERLDQKSRRVHRQRESGIRVDMSTNVLVTGPHENI